MELLAGCIRRVKCIERAKWLTLLEVVLVLWLWGKVFDFFEGQEIYSLELVPQAWHGELSSLKGLVFNIKAPQAWLSFGLIVWGVVRSWRFFRFHPALLLICWIGIGASVKEFPPFSHYPMYADPGTGNRYFCLHDEEGNVLPLQRVYKMRASQLSKAYRAYEKDFCRKLGVDRKELTRAHKEHIGKLYLERLMTKWNPTVERVDEVQLIEINVEHSGERLIEKYEVIATIKGR